MRAFISLCAVLVMALVLPRAAAASLDEAAVRRGLADASAGDYERALAAFDEVIARAPRRPEGYFFRAAVFQIMKGHFELAPLSEGLLSNANRALALAKEVIRNDPKDARAHLFAGLSYGVLSVEAAHHSRYVTAFIRAKRMVGLLKRALALDPSLEDAYYGLGVYHFQLSRAPWVRLVTWIVKDTGSLGVRYLRRAAERGRWLKTLARVDLVWVLYRERRFGEARETLAPLLERYPGHPLYALARAEGYFIEENYPRAKREYAALHESLKGRPGDYARLYAGFAEWRVVRCDYALGRYAEAGAGARAVMRKPDMNSTLLRQIRLGAASLLEVIEKADPAGRNGRPSR